MINRLLTRFQRPESGWDPVGIDHAEVYAAAEWVSVDEGLLDRLEAAIGPLSGRRVLDLGGGPGQYSAAMARRGAVVTWHDISRRYLQIARARISAEGLSVEFSLGYLEEASRFLDLPFDLVFNRICWRYCLADGAFADLVYGLVAPGGAGYVDSPHADEVLRHGWTDAGIRYRLNAILGIKIGHPLPPPGRITSLLRRNGTSTFLTEWSTAENERVLFIKGR